MNLTQKLISSHLVSGTMKPGREIAVSIDQTLTQDATGTMAYLEFEAMGIPIHKSQIINKPESPVSSFTSLTAFPVSTAPQSS